jgi:hypothetical protein
MPATSYPPTEDARSVLLRVLLSPGEKAALVQLSRERGVPVAEIVRTSLPLSPDTEREAA